MESHFSVGIILAFSLYTVVMISIGAYFYKKNDSVDSFLLGDRNINAMVSALSAGSSDMSAWLLLGLPGYMYSSGLASIWIAIGLLLGAYTNWSIIAKRLRVYTEMVNAITVSEYFKNRFHDNKAIINIIASIVILIFYTIYVSSGLIGGGKLFESVFGINYNIALLIGALIILSYTFLGGYNAVCWTDFIQGVIMMVALIVVPVMLIYTMGGINESINIIKPKTLLNPLNGLSLVGVISLLAWGLGYFGQPHILVRFMSITNKAKVKEAKIIGMSWMLISLCGALAVGFFGIAYYIKAPLADGEKIFIYLSETLFNSFIGGLLLSAILAAIMSTISSQLLVSSSAIASDLYKLVRKNSSQREYLMVNRISVIIIIVIALILALNKNSTVLGIVSHAWAGFGASFGPLILISLYYKKCSKIGAIAGIVSGALTIIIYPMIQKHLIVMYEIIPGFIISTICIFVFSKIFPPKMEVVEEFENISKEF